MAKLNPKLRVITETTDKSQTITDESQTTEDESQTNTAEPQTITGNTNYRGVFSDVNMV